MFFKLLKHQLKEFKFFFIISLISFILVTLIVLGILYTNFGIILSLYSIVPGIFFVFVLTILYFTFVIISYYNYFFSKYRYHTFSIPTSNTNLILSKLLTFIIIPLVFALSIVLPIKVLFIFNNFNFFTQYTLTDILNDFLPLLQLGLGLIVYVFTICLSINVSKLPQFKKIKVLSLIITIILFIASYEAITSIILNINLIDLTIRYISSIGLTLVIIGLEVFFIIKSLKKVEHKN